jgi:hypothetical protein
MRCYCCKQEIAVARKVKLRPWRDFHPSQGGPDSVAYQSYCDEMTFRWAFICNACYRRLDNGSGRAEILGHGEFNLAGASRGDKAAVVNEAMYRQFQRREAERMGLEP